MKSKIKNQIQTTLFAAVAGMLFSWSGAFGDDLYPPPYRNNPLSVSAEWQLLAGTNFLSLTQWSSVDDSDPSTYLYPNFTPTPQVQPIGDIYQLQLPNWVDQMPVKYMRLQLTWQGTAQPPINIFSEGLDGTNLISGTITSVSPLITMLTGYYQHFNFEFYPNPDFERVHIQLPPNALLSQVVIDTVSTIPEPATLLLLGLGSVSFLRKRKNYKC